MKLKDACSWIKAMTNTSSILKSWNIALPTKVPIVKAIVFPVVMYGCESWTRKKAECWLNYAFELWCCKRLLESPLNNKEIKPVNPKGNQPWIFIGRTDVETPIFWPSDVKMLTHWKRPWCWERLKAGWKGSAEDETVEWHHWLKGLEFEQTLGDNEGQRNLACCS